MQHQVGIIMALGHRGLEMLEPKKFDDFVSRKGVNGG